MVVEGDPYLSQSSCTKQGHENVAAPLEVSKTLGKGGKLKVKSEPGQYAILIVIISWSACCTPYIVSDPVFMCITFCRRAKDTFCRRVLYLITLHLIT